MEWGYYIIDVKYTSTDAIIDTRLDKLASVE